MSGGAILISTDVYLVTIVPNDGLRIGLKALQCGCYVNHLYCSKCW